MVHLRYAEERDARGIARVHVASWQKVYAGIMPDELLASLDPVTRTEDWEQELREGRGTAIVAVKAEEVRGFSYFSKCRDDDVGENVAEIQAIYVHPSHWRSGYGRLLLEDSLSQLKVLGFETVTLWVLSENSLARRFYIVMGFHEDGATKEHPETGLLELRYEKRLLEKLSGH